MATLQRFLQKAAFLHRPIGLICLVIGVLGWILPILPGWPFIIPAVALLGRRDPLIRHPHILLRRTLRRMRGARHAHVRALGLRASTEYMRVRRVVAPLIAETERRLRPTLLTSP
ncbi:MAG: hypothetical protein H7Z42_19905 [Roseiflexaceae bacterium]|nr:hypothetical protein [Roseiflexaceae bacterium]